LFSISSKLLSLAFLEKLDSSCENESVLCLVLPILVVFSRLHILLAKRELVDLLFPFGVIALLVVLSDAYVILVIEFYGYLW